MLIQDCKVGMRVVFGRETGQKTVGTVVKVNSKKAKIKTDEARGKFPAGAIWGVPYSMLHPYIEDEDASSEVASNEKVEVSPISYSPFQDPVDQLVLEAIACCYNALSPENLSCDGEIPAYLVQQRKSKISRKLKGLFSVIGREVDEMTVYNWLDQKRSSKLNEQKA